MEDVKLLNFAGLFLNTHTTELDEITAELKEAGITVGDKQDKIIELIRQKRSEVKLQTERRFKEEYLKMKADSTIKESVNDFADADNIFSDSNKTAETEKCVEADSIKRKLKLQKN